MNISLYVLADEYKQAATQLADLDLPDEVVADTLESLQFPIEQKAANVAMFVRNLESTAEAIRAAEGEMAKRRKALENRAASVREYLKANMLRTGITKIECPMFKISVRDNPVAVRVIDETAIPAKFMRQPEPPPPSPDKKSIGEALKAGEEVPGCALERGNRLEIK